MDKQNSLKTRSSLLFHKPGASVPQWECRLLSSISLQAGEGDGARASINAMKVSYHFKVAFSPPWRSIHLIAINLWFFFRVLTKLILTAFALLFGVSVEEWALGVNCSIFADIASTNGFIFEMFLKTKRILFHGLWYLYEIKSQCAQIFTRIPPHSFFYLSSVSFTLQWHSWVVVSEIVCYSA